MLQGMADLHLSDCSGSIFVPKQMVVLKDLAASADKVVEAGLKFPLVAKPLWIDGTAKSHELFLAYDRRSLAELDPPLVLEEFVNHGGVMLKVFVVGDVIKVVRRFSLPNVIVIVENPKLMASSSSRGFHRLLLQLTTHMGAKTCFMKELIGYGKMPDYEQVFVDFFQNLAQARHKKRHCKC